MEKEELLNLYLEKLRVICMEKMEENLNVKDVSVLEALKASFIYLEGEMSGY